MHVWSDEPEVPLRAGDEAVHPLIAVFDNAAIAATDLAARIDRLLSRGLPVICRPTASAKKPVTARIVSSGAISKAALMMLR